MKDECAIVDNLHLFCHILNMTEYITIRYIIRLLTNQKLNGIKLIKFTM